MSLTIPPEVARHLGYYVYLYVDPRNKRPFYVGKGQGERLLAHLFESGESRKQQQIAAIRAAGLEPELEVLVHALPDEETALRIESAVIDALGLDSLTNKHRGWKSVQSGRLPLSELLVYYAAEPVELSEPTLLIRINRMYRHGMEPLALYEATRGVWKVSARREKATYALAVFEGVVREAYRIESWHPAGSTAYSTRPIEHVSVPGRWEFIGTVAEVNIRNEYLGKSVSSYIKRGAQNPLVYVNC